MDEMGYMAIRISGIMRKYYITILIGKHEIYYCWACKTSHLVGQIHFIGPNKQ